MLILLQINEHFNLVFPERGNDTFLLLDFENKLLKIKLGDKKGRINRIQIMS